MAITNNNIPLIHRKEWQMMTPSPAVTIAGSFFVGDVKERDNAGLLVLSSTVQYLYHFDEDAYVQIASGALAGTFGAGSCGGRARWSNPITANGGTTTTITTATAINGLMKGAILRMATGTAGNVGREAIVSGVMTVPGGTSTIYLSTPLPSPVASTDTFRVDRGAFYIMNAGTVAAGSFKSYDAITGVWTSLSTTGLPATWATDGRLVATPSDDIFATGTATSATGTTLVNSAKTWTANQWTNYMVRIVSGTGTGQTRTISSNTGTTLTVPAWTVTPDATSVYEITGNDDFLYLLGNNAVTMYRYSISGNTWTTMAPTTARAGAMVLGGGANWIGKSGDANWANESDIKDGRYIYSFRAGATGTLDRFDIAGGTAGAGAWQNIAYVGLAETFTTGSSYAVNGRYIYVRKDATHRFFKFSLTGHYLEPLTTNLYPDGAAIAGDRLFIKAYNDGTADRLFWLYSLRNTGTELHRILLYP